MLDTPVGLRYIEEYEYSMLAFAVSKLAGYISKRIRAEEKGVDYEGVIFKPVKESSAFHGLDPKAQLVLLHNAFTNFMNPYNDYQNTQLIVSAFECVYSCLFYEVKRECEIGQRGPCYVRNHIYHAWTSWGISPIDINNCKVDYWANVVDGLAAKTVYPFNHTKQLDMGSVIVSPEAVMNAEAFFEGLFQENC